jgi:hypothetical protein
MIVYVFQSHTFVTSFVGVFLGIFWCIIWEKKVFAIRDVSDGTGKEKPVINLRYKNVEDLNVMFSRI